MECLIVVEEGLRHDCGVDALSCGRVLKKGISLCVHVHQVVTVRFLRGIIDDAELQGEDHDTCSDGHMIRKQVHTTNLVNGR